MCCFEDARFYTCLFPIRPYAVTHCLNRLSKVRSHRVCLSISSCRTRSRRFLNCHACDCGLPSMHVLLPLRDVTSPPAWEFLWQCFFKSSVPMSYQFPTATVTNYHTLCVLKQEKLTFYDFGGLKFQTSPIGLPSRYQQGQAPSGSLRDPVSCLSQCLELHSSVRHPFLRHLIPACSIFSLSFLTNCFSLPDGNTFLHFPQ